MMEQNYLTPGTVFVGGDSHTCTAGAFGIFATGFGATDIAGVMISGKLWIEVPEVICIKLVNKLKKGVTAYDLALYIVSKIGFNGALGKSIEYFGPGVTGLSMTDRMTISNFSVEMGAVTGIFEVDDICKDWCLNHGVSQKKIDAAVRCNGINDYDLEIDLNEVLSLIAQPSKPDNVVNIRTLKGIKVDQVFIGSCSGGYLSDIKEAATLLKGKKICSSVRLLVGMATKNILIEALRLGYLHDLIEAGAVILPLGCGACLGNIGTLGAGEVAVSTQNRNFKGRVGSKQAQIFLTSSTNAAKIALAGVIDGEIL